ncbi:unnamed protein product, partial [Didymodactylos carnosus]
MKYNRLFEVLKNLMHQDIRTFPMHIPDALAKLGDTRAIPLLGQTMNLQDSEGKDD